MVDHRPGELRAHRRNTSASSSARQLAEIGPIVVTGTNTKRPGLSTTAFDVSATGLSEPLAREIGHLWQARNNNGRISTAKQQRDALYKLLLVLKRHGIRRWSELTMEVLEELEQQFQQSKSGHRYALVIWDYLRSIPETSAWAGLCGRFPRRQGMARRFIAPPIAGCNRGHPGYGERGVASISLDLRGPGNGPGPICW
jgi:hypothetical protein